MLDRDGFVGDCRLKDMLSDMFKMISFQDVEFNVHDCGNHIRDNITEVRIIVTKEYLSSHLF